MPNAVTKSKPAAVTTAEQNAIDRHRETNRSRASILATVATRFGMDPDGFAKTLRSTVFKSANNEEFAALLLVANEYKLNPLTKEIYAFPQKGGGIVPLVSVDGWIRIMNEHPQFDGIEFNDIVDEEGTLYAIESVIWRKDRTRPIKVTEYLDECCRKTDPWDKSPKRMLRHRALQQGARIAFGFAGIYTEDEYVGDVIAGGNITPMPKRRAIANDPHRGETAREADYDPDTGEVDETTARDLDRAAYAEIDGTPTLTLSAAKARLDAIELAVDRDRAVAEMMDALSEDDAQALRDYAEDMA